MKIDGKMETEIQGNLDFSEKNSPKMALNCDGLIDGAIETETESRAGSENEKGIKVPTDSENESVVNCIEDIDVKMTNENANEPKTHRTLDTDTYFNDVEYSPSTGEITSDFTSSSVTSSGGARSIADSEVVNNTGQSTTKNGDSPNKSSKISDGLILVASPDHPLANIDHQINSDRRLSDIDAQNHEQTQNRKEKRRVRFPGDDNDNVVTSYHDAPDPWQNSKRFTPSELVATYKKACFQSGLKPIQKLILQLEATADVGERYETLTLKGERMTLKHCDTLEEIFRRVQFKTVDLEASDLDDDSAGSVFDMIEFYNSATRLVLAYNKSIGPRGWQACGRMLKRTPSLIHLDLRSCTISDHAMPFIGRALRVGSNLQILHLENAGVSAKVLLILVAALKLNDNLRELYLADNRLMPSDGIQLGNLLKHNDRLQLLDLRNNHLQDTGVSHICDGLEVHDQKGWGLTTLVLWNNQLTQHSMNKLAHALTSNRTLETLNLGHNNVSNEGVLYLKEGLLKNKSLKRMGLQCCRLFCEGAIAVAELIADSNRLLRVDLRENEIKTAGLMALSLSLKMNQSVTRLDLDKEIKKERGVKDYLEQQSCLLSDISNWLQRNREHAYCVEQVQNTDPPDRVKADLPQIPDSVTVEEKPDLVVEDDENNDDSQKRPKGKLHFTLESRSESLESPMVGPDDVPQTFDEEMECVTSQEDMMTSSMDDFKNLSRHGGRMFSVKYVPENSLSESDRSMLATPSDALVSPTLEFPLSLDPGDRVLPILVPVDTRQPRPQILPVDQHVDLTAKSETCVENETETENVSSEQTESESMDSSDVQIPDGKLEVLEKPDSGEKPDSIEIPDSSRNVIPESSSS